MNDRNVIQISPSLYASDRRTERLPRLVEISPRDQAAIVLTVSLPSRREETSETVFAAIAAELMGGAL